jgi:Amt family ammonium transporter
MMGAVQRMSALPRFSDRHAFHCALAQAASAAGTGALLLINIDHFKTINDHLGRSVGDCVLLEVRRTISSHLGPSDLLYRVEGDEFGVICSLDMQRAQILAAKLQDAIRAMTLCYGAEIVKVTASIGMSLINGDERGRDVVYRRAEGACRLAKVLGRERIIQAEDHHERISEDMGAASWSFKIQKAIKEDLLVLMGQPIQRLSSDTPSSLEILVRMLDENGELLCPAQFLPAAERFGLMVKLDQWVIRKTMKWMCGSPTHLRVSINLSATSIGSEDFQVFLLNLLANHPRLAKRITFELTENKGLEDEEAACAFMRRVVALGSKFALDDFGRGFSNYAMLAKLPLSIVKLDGSLIVGLAQDKAKQSIVSSVTRLAHEMNLEVTAEYVENVETSRWLKSASVDFAQGFFYSPPRHLTSYEAFV